MTCPVCEDTADVENGPGDYETVDCPRCGLYEISRSVLADERWQWFDLTKRRVVLDRAQEGNGTGAIPRLLPDYFPG